MLNNKLIENSFIKIKNTKIKYILKRKKSNVANFSVVFLCGYKSDMNGTKACYIDKLQKKIGFEYLRFDYSGHGSSEGVIEQRNLTNWVYESLTIIEKKTNHPIILIGSSMGGWISLLLAKKLKTKLLGIIGIATAIDFTMNIIDNLSQRKKLFYKKNLFIKVPNEHSKDGHVFTKKFIEDSKKHLVSKKKISLNCKVIFLYGRKDTSVKLSSQIKLLKIISAKEVSLIISNNSDHRMSSKSDLLLIEDNLQKLFSIKN